MQTITSRFLSINAQDVLKGLMIASGSAVFALIAESLQKSQFTFDFTAIWHTAAAAGFAYLGKQFFTPARAIKLVQ